MISEHRTIDERISDAIDRAECRIEKSGECWLWPGAHNGNGYATIAVHIRSEQRTITLYLHRVMYERYIGPIPDKFEIDHLCRIRNCVRPEHLEAVTRAENVKRQHSIITHCPRGHEYSKENTRISSEGKRACRTCGRDKAMLKRGRPLDASTRRGPNLRWTDAEIAEIADSSTTKDLVEKYGVSRTTIQSVKRKYRQSSIAL